MKGKTRRAASRNCLMVDVAHLLCPPDTRQRPLSPEARRVAYLGACPVFPPPRCLHLSCGKLPKQVCRKSHTIFSPPWGMNPFSVGCLKVSLTITCRKYRSRRILTMSWIQMSPIPADLLLDSPLLTMSARIRRCCLVSGGHSRGRELRGARHRLYMTVINIPQPN